MLLVCCQIAVIVVQFEIPYPLCNLYQLEVSLIKIQLLVNLAKYAFLALMLHRLFLNY